MYISGPPLKIEKIKGPLSVLIFLEIILDTVKQELRLPSEKIDEVKSLIAEWRRKLSCTKWELLQLIGKLAHATKVVVPGHTFLHWMIDTSTSVKHLYIDHHIKLRADYHSDLAWWDRFLPIEMLAVLCMSMIHTLNWVIGGVVQFGSAIGFSVCGSQHGYQIYKGLPAVLACATLYVGPATGPQTSASTVSQLSGGQDFADQDKQL